MTTWGEFRNTLRYHILDDETAQNWDNDALLSYLTMAQRLFAQHTAKLDARIIADRSVKIPEALNAPATLWDFTVDTVFPLPDNLIEPMTLSGQVYYELSGRRVFLDPIGNTQGICPASGRGYSEWTSNTIRLTHPTGRNSVLTMRYFTYWGVPTSDDSVLEVPDWSLNALGFLIAYYAVTPNAISYANINQWKAGNEKGNPEDNSVRTHQKYLWRMYEQELINFPQQQRSTMFRGLSDVHVHI